MVSRGRRQHNARMRNRRGASLAGLSLLVGLGLAGAAGNAWAVIDRSAVAGAPPVATPPATRPTPAAPASALVKPVAKPSTSPTVVVHRCTDARGHVTLQDDPCPRGTRDDAREMTRPKDPAPGPRRPPAVPRIVEAPDTPLPRPRRAFIPPPPMYQCTTYDGNSRFSESYDPNPRCEPLVIYYPYPNNLTPAQALSCRWVEDSCVRLDDRAACARWIQMRKDAVSEATRAFSDTADYRRSELARISQIVEESCP